NQDKLSSQVSQLQQQVKQYTRESTLLFPQFNKIYDLNLEQYIRQEGYVALKQGIQWMLQTCVVLHDIHILTPPLIHGNIHPSNLFLRKLDNRVLLLDHKKAKDMETLSENHIPFNVFSAPEQERGQLLPQSDLYAIGSTLIFLLTGKNPKEFYVRSEQDSFNLEEMTSITPQLQQVILRVTKLNPSNRYQTARELSKDLALCLPR
ncbi:MAG: hypothetical protein SAK29_14735, partial [Scytonema sp. PMC 1069.18]|nr:hypothetical protein [Scytonema sp. PMC 1069.18]